MKSLIALLLSLLSLYNCSYVDDKFLQELTKEVYKQKWTIPSKLGFSLRDVHNIKVPMTMSQVIQGPLPR